MRALTAALAAGAMAVALTACGSGAPNAGADGETVTVDGKYGPAEVPADAARVLPLSPQDADFVIAAGVAPIALPVYPEVVVSTDGLGAFPWQVDALAEMGYTVTPPDQGAGADALVDIPDGEIPALLLAGEPQSYQEAVAVLDPDVIVATGQWALSEDVYRELSKIAPVVHFDTQANVEPWQDSARKVGTALGREDEADASVRAAEAEIAAVRADHPEFEGAEYNAVIGDLGGELYILSGDDRGIGMVMADLGLELAPWAREVPTDADGRGHISYEYVSELDTEVLIVISPAGDIEYMNGNEQWRDLEAVRRGAVVSIARSQGVPNALGFPSPLSLPWGVDRIAEPLSVALARD